MQTDYTSSPSSHLFGKVLASGNGSGNSTIITTWVLYLLIAGILGGFCCVILPEMVREKNTVQVPGFFPGMPGMTLGASEANRKADIVFWFGILLILSCIVDAVLRTSGIVKTSITVYEGGIAGTGGGKFFDFLSVFDIQNFYLAHNKITSVDTTGTTITVHVSGAKYKCYVKNPAEIQRIIIEQQQKAKA